MQISCILANNQWSSLHIANFLIFLSNSSVTQFIRVYYLLFFCLLSWQQKRQSFSKTRLVEAGDVDLIPDLLTHKLGFFFDNLCLILMRVDWDKALKRWQQLMWMPLSPSTELRSSKSMYLIPRRFLVFRVSEHLKSDFSLNNKVCSLLSSLP